MAELVGTGRSFARLDQNGRVVFKAEIGAATTQACQIQGVWVAPEYRGQGFAAPGMAAVLRYALADVAPSSASTSTISTRPPARPTDAWASRRSGRS